MINTLPGFTHSAASECVRTAPILSKARGSFKTRSPSLLPFVKYCCAGDSFLIYLVNSWRVKKKEFYIMEMMEWVIISHIFITADIGPLWYRPPFGYCSLSLFAYCSPQWAKQALILSLFGMTMFTSYHSIRSQEHETHPSITKCCVNVLEPATETRCEPTKDKGEAGSTKWLDFFLCVCVCAQVLQPLKSF